MPATREKIPILIGWDPQLNTVGYLTGVAGSMAAGYAIGWMTGRFDPPSARIQLNLVGKYLDVQEVDDMHRSDCSCGRVRGWLDEVNLQFEAHCIYAHPRSLPVIGLNEKS
jgi:hypothetical protein